MTADPTREWSGNTLENDGHRHKEARAPSAAVLAAAKLRDLILARDEGAYLGSQTELENVLEVGRVTLSKAARILEHEQLLRVRRGVNGGYYGTRPDETGVEKAVVLYLYANRTDFPKVLRIAHVLSTEMLRLAAMSSDEAGRKLLQELEAKFNREPYGEDALEILHAEQAFSNAIFRLANNPFGELMMRVTSRIFEKSPLNLLQSPSDIMFWQQTRLKMIRAILEHEVDYVDILSERFGEKLRSVVNDAPPIDLGLPSVW